jgi:hypothetical protein
MNNGVRHSAGLIPVALALLCALPMVGHADCWTIETTSGKIISTSDLWQIRSRITETSELIGKVNGEKSSINLMDVAGISIDQPGHRGEFNLNIRLLDERTLNLRSDMDLYYLIDGNKKKKRPIRLADISAVNRCPDAIGAKSAMLPAAASAAPSSTPAAEISAVVATTSGDVLNGELTDDFMWQTSYGVVTFKPEDIKLIIFQCGPEQTGLLETFSGDSLNGTAKSGQLIAVRLSTGQALSIPAEQIKYIDRQAISAGDQNIVTPDFPADSGRVVCPEPR